MRYAPGNSQSVLAATRLPCTRVQLAGAGYLDLEALSAHQGAPACDKHKGTGFLGGINLGRLALRVTDPAFSCSNKPDLGSHLSRMLMRVQ